MSENPQEPSAESGQQQPYVPPPPYAPPPPPPPMGAQGYGAQSPALLSPSDARMWSMFAHLGGLLLSPVIPLVIFLVYKDRDSFVRRHSAQALNFQIWVYIAYMVSVPLMFLLVGFLTFAIAAIASLVFSIIATVAANKGEEYTYPLVPTLIS